MKDEEKKTIADTLNEVSTLIKVGALPLKIRPLTLGQIYEMGAVANDIDVTDITGSNAESIRIMPAIIQHHKDARRMQEIFVICAFRSRIKRFLFGWYIRRKLRVVHFQELISYISTSFNANFFLTSIIFLRQTVIMTEPSPTTAPGQQSEE